MDIKQEITSTFEKNLYSLGLKYQYHWCLRNWRLKEDEKYLQAIFTDFQRRTIKNFHRVRKIDKWFYVGRKSKAMLANYKTNTPKKRLRVKAYFKNPKILFYLQINLKPQVQLWKQSNKKLTHQKKRKSLNLTGGFFVLY